MAGHTSDISDGEIVGDKEEDLSEISSDDYFSTLKDSLAKAKKRKMELELENVFADFGKENHFANNRSKQQQRMSKNKKRKLSGKVPPTTYERSRRASSVFSNYSIRKSRKVRSRRKEKRPRQENLDTSVNEDSDEDEELLMLRLNALKSKLEVKDLIDDDGKQENGSTQPEPPEEENLRIIALKSAILKKRESFKERKKLKMMENERPYSPSDDVSALAMEDMILSPLGSPFGDLQEVDMDISNSPMNEEKETSDMDVETKSPGEVEAEQLDEEAEALRSLLLTSIHKKKEIEKTRSPTPEVVENDQQMEQNLKLAVQRLKQKKHVIEKPAVSGTKTIAMVLEEQKMKKKVQNVEKVESSESVDLSLVAKALEARAKAKKATKSEELSKKQKSLENSKTKEVAQTTDKLKKPSENTQKPAQTPEIIKNTQKLPQTPEIIKKTQKIPTKTQSLQSTPTADKSLISITANVTADTPKDFTRQINKPLDNFIAPEPVQLVPEIPPTDENFSTITDTKNIPLIPTTEKGKRSRLVTSLESVIKPVSRLVISLGGESDTDDDGARKIIKKTPRRIVKAPASTKPKTAALPGFEQNLDSFLKTIREKTVSGTPETPAKPPPTKSIMSSVKHLPKSSQLEYEELIKKMKILEEAKQKRLRQLKRTKSNSGSAESVQTASMSPKKLEKPKSAVVAVKKPETKKSSDKISESLSKVSQLDPAAQQRLIEKTEINYKNHSDKLLTATQQSLKLLDENETDMQKQLKLSSQIAELEKTLKKYKSSLNVVTQRVKVNVHKIVQSQREMLKLLTHQKNFGNHICIPVGKMVRGETYNLPEHRTEELETNFNVIAGKTEEIVKKSTDQNVKNSMKLIADRVKSFASVKVAVEPVKLPETSANVESTSKPSEEKTQTVEKDESDSEVMKMLKETSENPPRLLEKPVEIEFPNVKKTLKGIYEEGNGKRSASPVRDQKIEKKLKYESPLDFLRVPKCNTPSVNQILCPYQLEGTCNDVNCKMLHI